MVILIGAESMTGKTLMAQKLLETYKIPYISEDHIKMGLYRSGINCGFKPDDSNEIIEQRLWPIFKGIIETNIENNQSVIIEGSYILPKRIKEFGADYLRCIIPVFMGFSENYLIKHFTTGVLGHRDVIERRAEADDRGLEWFISANKELKKMCRESGTRYFEIDSDYEKDTAEIYKWITSEAGEMGFR